MYEDSYHRSSFRYLFGINTALLSRRVTETASKVGEHYISTDKAGYRRMYKKRHWVVYSSAVWRPLKSQGKPYPWHRLAWLFKQYDLWSWLCSNSYHWWYSGDQTACHDSCRDCFNHLRGKGRKAAQFTKLTELVVDIMRTQFIAIMGNISIAMPIALLISSMWLYGLGRPLTSEAQRSTLLHDLNPFTSLAIFHAAIAGVYLYISGLIAGYYDNLAVHNKIGERIRNQPPSNG